MGLFDDIDNQVLTTNTVSTLNNTNTREMPLYLVRLYESVYDSIEAIIESETIILERKEV